MNRASIEKMRNDNLIKRFSKAVIGSVVGAGLLFSGAAWSAGTIKIGILHSLSGTMAIRETSLRDVALMTIEEITHKSVI